jgi:hypothetical protein
VADFSREQRAELKRQAIRLLIHITETGTPATKVRAATMILSLPEIDAFRAIKQEPRQNERSEVWEARVQALLDRHLRCSMSAATLAMAAAWPSRFDYHTS